MSGNGGVREHRAEDMTPQDGDRRWFRRQLLEANWFEALFGFMAAVTGAAYLVAPDTLQSAAVADASSAPLLVVMWGVMYVFGGAAVVAGLLGPWTRTELVGLLLLAPACLIDALALVLERGAVGVRVALIYAGAAAACALRARLLLKFRGD